MNDGSSNVYVSAGAVAAIAFGAVLVGGIVGWALRGTKSMSAGESRRRIKR